MTTNSLKRFHYICLLFFIVFPLHSQTIKEGSALMFFPEGGRLLPGVQNKVACKVLTEEELVSGFIADEKKKQYSMKTQITESLFKGQYGLSYLK